MKENSGLENQKNKTEEISPQKITETKEKFLHFLDAYNNEAYSLDLGNNWDGGLEGRKMFEGGLDADFSVVGKDCVRMAVRSGDSMRNPLREDIPLNQQQTLKMLAVLKREEESLSMQDPDDQHWAILLKDTKKQIGLLTGEVLPKTGPQP